jgi:hypothetical protein
LPRAKIDSRLGRGQALSINFTIASHSDMLPEGEVRL